MSIEKDTEIHEEIEDIKRTIDTATSILEYANKSYLEDVEKKRNDISNISIAKHFDTHFFVFARVKQIYKKIKKIKNIKNNDEEFIEIKNKLETYINAINKVDRYEGKIEDYMEELAGMLKDICDIFNITKLVGLIDGFIVDQRTNNVTMAPTYNLK